MTLQEFRNQALQLSVDERWHLVRSLLSSIQQDTLSSNPLNSSPPDLSASLVAELDPWTQSLLGVIQLNVEDPKESYIDYLEEKYS
jgi:hypothetical protein